MKRCRKRRSPSRAVVGMILYMMMGQTTTIAAIPATPFAAETTVTLSTRVAPVEKKQPLDSDADTSVNEDKSALVFTGDCTLQSEAFPIHERTMPNYQKTLLAFVQQTEIRNLLLTAGGRRPCRNVPITPEIQTLWEQANQKHAYNHCTETLHAAMATDTEAQFPGFKIITTVLNGCRILVPETTTNGRVPVYEFCLMGDKKRIVGLPPVVWLVRKLMSMPEDSDQFQLSETRAKSTISIVPALPPHLQGSDASYWKKRQDRLDRSAWLAFKLDLEFAISVEFPRVLLRLLPTSKSKVEERGTNAVSKSVQKDAADALQIVRERWMKQVEEMEQ